MVTVCDRIIMCSLGRIKQICIYHHERSSRSLNKINKSKVKNRLSTVNCIPRCVFFKSRAHYVSFPLALSPTRNCIPGICLKKNSSLQLLCFFKTLYEMPFASQSQDVGESQLFYNVAILVNYKVAYFSFLGQSVTSDIFLNTRTPRRSSCSRLMY